MDRAGLFEAFAPGWEPPTGAEVRELLKVAQLTSSTAGRLVGVPGGKVRKWAGDDGSMPYAVWRLLAVYARQAPPSVMALNKELTN
ncbi:TPA: transcriptional regulator [Pseudomonas aeruginosa]|nr:transcriptional regulator [Pseudomonas aeruginosa]